MERIFKTAVEISHFFLQLVIRPGDKVIDATCGNGHDTVLLAKLVEDAGHVYGFDIQPQAIINTGEKIKLAGLEKRVTLFNVGHQKMKNYLNMPVQAIMFNLGYLPGGSHQVITTKETTLTAIQAGATLLTPKGVIILVLYPGHPGGQEEAASLLEFAGELPKKDWDVVSISHLNRSQEAPQVLLLQRCSQK